MPPSPPSLGKYDPLTPEERATEIAKARPRRDLPIAPIANPGARHLPLVDDVRSVDRKYRPIYVVWELTLACDLACRHCGSRAGRDRPDELTHEEAMDLATQIADLGAKEVTVIGGEAYLREDWLDIVRLLRSRGVIVGMTTGARGLTPELIAKAKEAGLQAVSVSIDGDEETHDRLRGVPGSYKAAFRALRSLKEHGIRTSCNTQINRLSVPVLDHILDAMVEVGATAWQTQLTGPIGRAADEPDIILQPYELLEVYPRLAALKQRGEKLGVRMWPSNNVGYFGPYESIMRGSTYRGHGGSCGAGRLSMGIEANGAIKGCPSLPSTPYTGGNIRDAKLVDIWERSLPLRFTRERTRDDLSGFCKSCYYADECLAGCNWMTHTTFGKTGDNPYCHHRAIEMDLVGKRERVVPVSPAPGQPFDHGIFKIVVESNAS